MRKSTCLKAIIVSSFVFVISSSNATFAVNENSGNGAILNKNLDNPTVKILKKENTEALSDLKDKMMQQREEWVQKKCQLLSDNIDNRISKFDENKNTHVEKYKRVKTALQNLITKLEAKEINVDELKEDLHTLDEKIQNFAADYATFINALKATKEYACGESDGDFADALAKAKEALLKVRADAGDIKEFYNSTVRPDVVSIRQEMSSTAKNKESEN